MFLYLSTGILSFASYKSLNEKSPDFSGPITLQGQTKRRIAALKTVSKDGNTKFLSCRIGDSTPKKDDVVTDQTVVEHEPVNLGGEDPDDIPW